MDEATLIEKLLKIEALFAGAATEGERASADLAKQRILKRLQELLPEDPPVEYKFTFRDLWSRKVFVTLLRRYGIKPYRYYRQRYTTVMAQLPKRFVDETLWPEFQKINEELNSYLHEVTDRVVKKVLHEDSSDAVVVDEPLQIEMENLQSIVSGQPETSDNGRSVGSSHNNPTHSQRKKKKSKKHKKKKKKGRRR
jgi:tRNA nucleotidyltransferase (CCA-adding enzyme)